MSPSKRLFLSRVADDFNPERDVALGPWCFIGAETVYPNWESLSFNCPHSDAREIIGDDQKTARLMNHLAAVWKGRMNERHNRDYSILFWRTLLAPWLTAAIQACWRRWRHMEEQIDSLKELPLTATVLPALPEKGYTDLTDFVQALEYDSFGILNYWLSSLILERLAPPSWEILPDKNPGERIIQAPAPELGRRSIGGKFAHALFGRLPFNHIHGTRLSKIPFSLLLNILPKSPGAPPQWAKDEAAERAFPKNFLEVIEAFLEETLPRAYGENFSHWETLALGEKYVPGRLLVDHLIPTDPKNQFMTAMAQERGEKLVASQHGGMFGTSATIYWTSETEYRHFAFITWGWSRQGRHEGNMVALPSPFLGKLKNRHKQENNRLIFVGTKFGIFGTRLDSTPNPEQWVHYRRMKKEFFATLDDAMPREIFYRPYLRSAPSLTDAEYVIGPGSEIRELGGDLHDAMLKCRLLVLDHPGTTLNIALAGNVPFIAYWDPKAWAMCAQAQPFFDKLRDARILHDTPVAAATQVNAVWQDVDTWWSGEDIQNTRAQWCHSYARTSRFWWWSWARALVGLALPVSSTIVPGAADSKAT